MSRLFFRVKLFQLKEQLHVMFHYYRHLRFALVDIGLCVSAFFFNPYRICRKFTNAHSYGETPISTFAMLAKKANLTAIDRFVDLGSGRGKLSFWAALWIGCSSIGVEQVPFFVRQARGLAWLFRIPIQFDRRKIETVDLSHATVVYLYVMQWDEIQLLQMPKGARLISVGAPAGGEEAFEVICVEEVLYPWGTAQVYIQRRV